jgi:uncharacterized membrane protein
VAVIDRLAGALEEVLGQPLQRKVMRDEQACVRVVADRSDIDGVLDASFDAIRQSGSGVPGILIKLADTFGKRAPAVTSRRHGPLCCDTSATSGRRPTRRR